VRILVAPDKFKGSLGAAAVAQHIAAGLRDVLPLAEIMCLPVADGGEGTAEVICGARGGTWHECDVHDPLGRIVRASYCTSANGQTAVLEVSAAAGLWRLAPEECDPLRANTFGVGRCCGMRSNAACAR
jgi:glycerate kinase